MSFSEGNRRYVSYVGGSSNPIKTGSIYRGTVTNVSATGMVRVRIPDLGNQVTKYAHALRGPETNPYLVDDQVLCIFLNNELSELFVLGRFNYQPKFRSVGINVHDPQYPVHIAGVDHEFGIAVQIDRTSAVGSSRADLQLHKTIVGAGAATAAAASGGGTFSDEAAVDGFQGDFYVYDYHTEKFLIQHTGGQNTAGGLTGNILNTYFAIKATGKHGDPTGTFDRTLYYYPTYDAKTGGSDGTGREVNYWHWTGQENAAAGTRGYTWYSMSYGYWGGGWYPGVDNSYDLGWSSYRWDDIWATNNVINTSDRNFKTDIVDSDLGLDFINALRPVSFKWKETRGRSGVRTHYGLIGQEVEVVLGNAASDTALWINTLIEADPGVEFTDPETGAVTSTKAAVEEHYRQGIRYGELISPLIKAVQELTARVEALEGQ
jgi:hypothetical protein